MVLHGDFDLDLRARLEVRALQVHERDVLLQHRRPRAGRGVAHLPRARVNRDAAAHGRGGNLRRHADRGVLALEPLPVDLEADHLPARPFAVFAFERAAADEVARLVEAHGPAEAHFVGRRPLARDPGVSGRGVVDVEHEQAGFDTRHVHGQDAGGRDAIVVSRGHQRVPDDERIGGVHPDLVTQVAGVPGAGNGHPSAGNRVERHAEVLERVDRLLARVVQDGARLGSLQAERRHLLGDFDDGHVHADCVHVQPAQLRLGGSEAVDLLVDARDRAVVQQLAVVVAPAGVVDLPDLQLVDVARGQAVQQARCVTAGDLVFDQRRDVDQRGVVADRPVLAVEPEIVRAHGEAAAPAAPVVGQAQCGRARVKRGPAQLVQRMMNGGKCRHETLPALRRRGAGAPVPTRSRRLDPCRARQYAAVAASRPVLRGIRVWCGGGSAAVADVDERQELVAGAGIRPERAEHLRGDHRHAALVDAPGGHALVRGFDHDAHALRQQHVVDAASNLGGHFFLHLEAAREHVHHPGELADADHLARGQVAHVRAPDDGRHVMLAVRLELDVAQHDHLVVTGRFFEGAQQVLARVDGVAREPVGIGVDDTFRRVEQAFASGIFTGPAQQRAYRGLSLGAADLVALHDGRRVFLGGFHTGRLSTSLRFRMHGHDSRSPGQSARRLPRQRSSRMNPATMPPRCAKCAIPCPEPVTPRYSSSRP